MNNVTYIAEWKERENKAISLETGIPIKILNDIDKNHAQYRAYKKQCVDDYNAMQAHWWIEDRPFE